MRRTGKTTLLRSIYEEISSPNKVFLDLENPLYQKYFEEEDYERIKFTFELQGLTFSRPNYIFLDKIQFVKNLPSVVKYLYDYYKCKFFLSGSSSFYLKNLFSESLAGRKYIFELFPLNYREFLRLKGDSMKLPNERKRVTKTVYQIISRYFDEYIQFGGFPGVISKESAQEKKLALNDIFSSYFQLKVVHLGDFRKITIMRDLIILLFNRAGSKLDIQKISQELGVSRPTIYEYLSFLEGTYFIHLIKPYSKSRDVEIRGAYKVYACDCGLLNQIASVNEGSLFENAIFQLLRPNRILHYYQKNSTEIDFIVNRNSAIEVKLRKLFKKGFCLSKML